VWDDQSVEAGTGVVLVYLSRYFKELIGGVCSRVVGKGIDLSLVNLEVIWMVKDGQAQTS